MCYCFSWAIYCVKSSIHSVECKTYPAARASRVRVNLPAHQSDGLPRPGAQLAHLPGCSWSCMGIATSSSARVGQGQAGLPVLWVAGLPAAQLAPIVSLMNWRPGRGLRWWSGFPPFVRPSPTRPAVGRGDGPAAPPVKASTRIRTRTLGRTLR